MIDIRRTIIWVILLGAGGFLISCDEGPPVPISPETTWTSLRYHEYGAEGSVDLLLDHNGNIDVNDKREGKEIAQNGFLSKNSVVELDMLVAAVEPLPSRAKDPCPEGPRFFVSITQGGDLLSFGGSPCQPLPAGQTALANALSRIVGYHSSYRPIVYKTIDQGRGHLRPGHYILRNQDDVNRTLQKLSPSLPVIWPSIRFDEEMIIGVVGESEFLDIQVIDLALTEDGQIRMSVLETVPDGPCRVEEGRPHHFVRMPVIDSDLFIERKIDEVPCGDF